MSEEEQKKAKEEEKARADKVAAVQRPAVQKPTIPDMSHGDKNMKTSVTTQKAKIKEFLKNLKDLGELQVLLPVKRRAELRYKEIQADSQASHHKVEGQFYTVPPKLHIAELKKNVLSLNEAVVSFSVYETDEKGDKIPFYQYADSEDQDGKPRRKLASSQYRIKYLVKETIRLKQETEQEITEIDLPAEEKR